LPRPQDLSAPAAFEEQGAAIRDWLIEGESSGVAVGLDMARSRAEDDGDA